MKIKTILTLLILIMSISAINGSANDIYTVSDNIVTKNNDYKIVLSDNVISDLIIDNSSLYFFSRNFVYYINNSNGEIEYKINILNLKNIVQTNDYIFVNSDTYLYQLNKTDGSIINKTIFSFLDKIYSVYGISSGDIINNYYNTYNYYNESFYLNLMNGSVTLLAGDNVTLSEDLINKTITIASVGGGGIEVSDDTKVNKSGDIMTGILYVPNISITSPSSNTNYGYKSGLDNIGEYQTALGYYAGQLNTGAYQTALGYASGYQNTGDYQTSVGVGAGTYNIGNNTVFIGYESGYSNIENNLFILKQNNVNTIPLMTGNFLTGTVDIPGGNLNMSGNNIINNPQITSLQNDKVNKSGDNMTGLLRVNVTNPYTGGGLTLLEFGRNSSQSKFRATLNDANGAFNFRVNIKDDLTQDIITGSGWSFAMMPATHTFGVTRIIPGTTTPENIIQLLGTEQLTNGRIYLGSSSNTSRYPVTIYNLSGAGNAYACLDSAGTLFRSSVAC